MFPLLYHAHNIRNSEDLDFWLELAKRTGEPILELGCGTGRVLSHLAQTSAQIYGLDHDFGMLKYLTENAPAAALSKTHFFQGDFTSFHLEIRFALIVMPCNTYTTLTSHQRANTLERVHFHLQPDGVFVASMPNPNSLKCLPRRIDPEVEEIFPHPIDGEPVQVSSAWRRSSSQMTITWLYDHLLPDGKVDRFQYEVIQHIIPIETIMHEFQSAALNVTEVYGDFDRSPLSEGSPYLILVSNRQSEGRF